MNAIEVLGESFTYKMFKIGSSEEDYAEVASLIPASIYNYSDPTIYSYQTPQGYVKLPINEAERTAEIERLQLTRQDIHTQKLNPYIPPIWNSESENNLYMIKDGIIIGYIISEEENIELDKIKHIESEETTIVSLRIEWVVIHPDFQSRKLCTPMLSAFIREMNNSTRLSCFKLWNIGGIAACKCYIKAFNENGYTAYNGYYCDEKIDADACMHISDDGLFMFFISSDMVKEGKAVGGRKQNKKSRKNKSIKNKSRKNKSRKNKSRKNKSIKYKK